MIHGTWRRLTGIRFPWGSIPGHLARPVLRTAGVVFAIAYFLFDALVFGLLAPVVGLVARNPVFRPVTAWARGLGPYPTLAIFLIPIIGLEPMKPYGAWLIATGRPWTGLSVLILAEIVKITIVERLYHLSRDKLLTIAAFAFVHRGLTRLLNRLKALPGVPATLALAGRLKDLVRRLFETARQDASRNRDRKRSP